MGVLEFGIASKINTIIFTDDVDLYQNETHGTLTDSARKRSYYAKPETIRELEDNRVIIFNGLMESLAM